MNLVMKDYVTAKERLNLGQAYLTPNYYVEASCDDCGEDIKECFFTNSNQEVVHVTTVTKGYYYSDGTTRCEDCHEGNR